MKFGFVTVGVFELFKSLRNVRIKFSEHQFIDSFNDRGKLIATGFGIRFFINFASQATINNGGSDVVITFNPVGDTDAENGTVKFIKRNLVGITVRVLKSEGAFNFAKFFMIFDFDNALRFMFIDEFFIVIIRQSKKQFRHLVVNLDALFGRIDLDAFDNVNNIFKINHEKSLLNIIKFRRMVVCKIILFARLEKVMSGKVFEEAIIIGTLPIF